MPYDPDLLTSLDKARALLGDTSNDPATELLTDDHIEAVLALYATSFDSAVAFLADELVVTYAQQPDSVTLPSGLSVRWSERVKAWQALAARLRVNVTAASYAVFSRAARRNDGYTEYAAGQES